MTGFRLFCSLICLRQMDIVPSIKEQWLCQCRRMEITCGITGESFEAVFIQTNGGQKNLTFGLSYDVVRGLGGLSQGT